MALVPLELPMQSNPGRYGHDGNVRLINCYPEKRGKEGKIAFPLYVADGLTAFSTLTGGGATRGMIRVGSTLKTVSGRTVFNTTLGGTSNVLGGFAGDAAVFMAQNQKSTPQVAMVSAGKRAIIESDVLSPISDTDLEPPSSVAFINQYFVYTGPNGKFQWSSLSEGTEYDPLDFATAEYGPDGLERAFVRRGELLLFGENTIEPWYTPASGDSAFLRSGSVIERGVLNGATIAMLEETPIFVADDGTVRALEGYAARRISNHAVEVSLHDTADRNAVSAFVYSKEGHSFYVLTGLDFTWVYDAQTDAWHERESYGIPRWTAQYCQPFGGFNVVGDYNVGKLYRINEDEYTEDGTNIVMTVQFPVHAYPRKIKLNELRVDVIPGSGLNSSDTHVSDPKIMLEVSNNGGKTFGNQRTATMGKTGNYSRQVRFNRLGSSNEDGFVLRLSMSAGVVRAITGISADTVVLKN